MGSELDGLLRERLEVDVQVQNLRERKRKLTADIDRLVLEEQARAKLEAMSDPERAALAQVIRAEGVESQEDVRGVR